MLLDREFIINPSRVNVGMGSLYIHTLILAAMYNSG